MTLLLPPLPPPSLFLPLFVHNSSRTALRSTVHVCSYSASLFIVMCRSPPFICRSIVSSRPVLSFCGCECSSGIRFVVCALSTWGRLVRNSACCCLVALGSDDPRCTNKTAVSSPKIGSGVAARGTRLLYMSIFSAIYLIEKKQRSSRVEAANKTNRQVLYRGRQAPAHHSVSSACTNTTSSPSASGSSSTGRSSVRPSIDPVSSYAGLCGCGC
jgi:hypothetical protein